MRCFFIYDNNNLHFPYKKKLPSSIYSDDSLHWPLHEGCNFAFFFSLDWILLPPLGVADLQWPSWPAALCSAAQTAAPDPAPPACRRSQTSDQHECVCVRCVCGVYECPLLQQLQGVLSAYQSILLVHQSEPLLNQPLLLVTVTSCFNGKYGGPFAHNWTGCWRKSPQQNHKWNNNLLIWSCLCVYVWCTCFHKASQSSLHHSSSAVDVFLLCLQCCQLAQHILAGVLQTLTTNPTHHTHTHTHTITHEHTPRHWQTVTEKWKGERKQENTEEEGQEIKGWAKNQKNHAVNEASLMNWRQTQK